MNNWAVKVVIIVLSVAIGYLYGYNKKPDVVTKIEVKEVKTYVDRIITKTVNKDGKIVTITREKIGKLENVMKLHETVKTAPKKWIVDLKAPSRALTGSLSDTTLTMGLNRRILGGLFAGVYGSSRGEFGFSLAFTF